MTSETTFAELGVPEKLVAALSERGIEHPFEVQSATIPDALAGRDVLGRAPTGSGKTLAFGLPLLAQLKKGKPRRPRGLILAPTRELAEQIRRELDPLAGAVGATILAVYGGVGFGPQLKALRQGVDLLVACPGRLQDLISQGEVSLNEVNQVVVDEADRMADMGFLPAVRELLDLTSPDRRTVLFSATLDKEVEVLTKQYQRNPVRHEVGELEPDLTLVEHRFLATEKETKLGISADLIDDLGPTMIFCRTRHGVDRLARQLKRVGVKAGWIHGGRTQKQRDAALEAFTSGRVSVLVATDVAARGIHVDNVACVIHFDPPADHKDYVHRSGRTARAGSGGVVVSLINPDQRKAVSRLQKQVGLPISAPQAGAAPRPREIVKWVDERQTSSDSTKKRRNRSGGAVTKSKYDSSKGSSSKGSSSRKPSATENGGPGTDSRRSTARSRDEQTHGSGRSERTQQGRSAAAHGGGRSRAGTGSNGRDDTSTRSRSSQDSSKQAEGDSRHRSGKKTKSPKKATSASLDKRSNHTTSARSQTPKKPSGSGTGGANGTTQQRRSTTSGKGASARRGKAKPSSRTGRPRSKDHKQKRRG